MLYKSGVVLWREMVFPGRRSRPGQPSSPEFLSFALSFLALDEDESLGPFEPLEPLGPFEPLPLEPPESSRVGLGLLEISSATEALPDRSFAGSRSTMQFPEMSSSQVRAIPTPAKFSEPSLSPVESSDLLERLLVLVPFMLEERRHATALFLPVLSLVVRLRSVIPLPLMLPDLMELFMVFPRPSPVSVSLVFEGATFPRPGIAIAVVGPPFPEKMRSIRAFPLYRAP